jgi:hypothetical protein
LDPGVQFLDLEAQQILEELAHAPLTGSDQRHLLDVLSRSDVLLEPRGVAASKVLRHLQLGSDRGLRCDLGLSLALAVRLTVLFDPLRVLLGLLLLLLPLPLLFLLLLPLPLLFLLLLLPLLLLFLLLGLLLCLLPLPLLFLLLLPLLLPLSLLAV